MKSATAQRSAYLALFLITALLFLGAGTNDIWTPNEGFYAEAVREMHESGNYLDTFFNYEPRLRKPPMTYWVASVTTAILGTNEFSLRLPSLLGALGTILLTFLSVRERFGERMAWLSVLCLGLSLQLVINARYLSPEITLTFFLSLTLFALDKAFRSVGSFWFWVAYLGAGLTVLVKGFPFLVVVGFVALGLFYPRHRPAHLALFKALSSSRIIPGLLLAGLVSGWWYLYSYLSYPEEFVATQLRETVTRAFDEKPFSFLDLFFYFQVILWGFLPFSLIFYWGFIEALRRKELWDKFRFELVWLLTFLLLFTAASGKLPPYLIPAYPPLAILAAFALDELFPKNRRLGNALTLIPAGLFGLALLTLSILGAIYLSPSCALWTPIALLLLFLCYRSWRPIWLPFVSWGVVLAFFALEIMSFVEDYRPYDKIGAAAERIKISPVLVEAHQHENMPYYLGRKVEFKLTADEISRRCEKGPCLALVAEETLTKLPKAKVLWRGPLYVAGSESKTAVLIKNIVKYKAGEGQAFKQFVLVHI